MDGCVSFGEESLGFMERWCWIMFGGGDFRESVVENRLFFVGGKGEMVW